MFHLNFNILRFLKFRFYIRTFRPLIFLKFLLFFDSTPHLALLIQCFYSSFFILFLFKTRIKGFLFLWNPTPVLPIVILTKSICFHLWYRVSFHNVFLLECSIESSSCWKSLFFHILKIFPQLDHQEDHQKDKCGFTALVHLRLRKMEIEMFYKII